MKIASDIESSSCVCEPLFVPGELPDQCCRPAQRPRIDVEKTQRAASALLADRLCSIHKT